MGWECAVAWIVCPLCRPGTSDAGLTAAGASLRCARGHAFDIAADGHVNLLPATRRLPDTVGDSKAMLQARRRFLEQGHYAPLSDALNRMVERNLAHLLTSPVTDGSAASPPALGLTTGGPIAGSLAEGGPASVSPTAGDPTAGGRSRAGIAILDVGCGEGYYLRRLRQHLAPSLGHTPLHTFGVDVAKAGVSLAARRDAGGRFVVADGTVRLPFATRSMQVLLSVFAPRSATEFGRVLAPGGLLLVAIPMPDHLREARAVVPLL
ncbi:MAG: methyltransferase domain-containing protein, partial [Chloroflexota bacterium]|nr:methyltransferase domain-containing protein [Chloroflexota bacterium]